MDLGDQGVLGGPRWMIWWMIWMGGSFCHEEDDGRAKRRFGTGREGGVQPFNPCYLTHGTFAQQTVLMR